MNEIEYAITNFEEFLEADIGQGDLHMCSAETALTALREQAEKSTGCEYCNNVVSTNQAGREFYKPLPTDSISSQGEMCLAYDKDGWSIHFEDCNDTGVMCVASIGKCPMCGKRLEVEP